MWARLTFPFRRFLLDLGGHLGSWRLSIVLMVAAALYYAFLAIWATSSPPHVVRNIAALTPFLLVYALLLLNTAVCLWRRLPRLRREISASPVWSDRPPDWSASVDTASPEGAGALIRGLGFSPRAAAADRVVGVRRRWTIVGTFLFHCAFFLVAAGFLTSSLLGQRARVWVAVGEDFESRPDQFLSHGPPRLLASGVPRLSFRVERILPEYWRDQLLFTRLEAELELPDARRTTRINRPLWLGWGTFLRLSGFGYAPRYQLSDTDGRVLDSAFVKLNVFPPGARDYFTIPGYPHRIHVEVLPDFAVDDGQPTTASLDLVNPAVVVDVTRGHLRVGGGVLRRGESLAFEGRTLRFPEIRYWGEFSIIDDAGVPLVLLGYLAGLMGLLLKLSGPRAEIEWRPRDRGGGLLRGWGRAAPRSLAGRPAG